MQQASLYIHIPFCVRKCPYCDFNSYATEHRSQGFKQQAAQYVDAIIAEYNYYCSATSAANAPALEQSWEDYHFDTVFLGGGTPSLLPEQELTRLLTTLKSSGRISTAAEVTFEANPGTIEELLGQEKLSAAYAAGFNRISFGSQSFSKRKLELLGRIHLPEDTLRAVEYARVSGFANINLDLIYGVKGETQAELEFDLAQLFSINPQHISAYCLTIEPGTEFGKLSTRGIEMTSGEDFQGEAYLYVLRELENHGFLQYEVSNFAQTARECRHNLGYWSGKPYLGLGAGASSYLPTSPPWLRANDSHSHSFSKDRSEIVARRWTNLPGSSHYLAAIREKKEAQQTYDPVDRLRALKEFFFLRLRRRGGFNEAEFVNQFGEPIPETTLLEVKTLLADGLLATDRGQTQLTAQGFLFSNSVFDRLVDSLP